MLDNLRKTSWTPAVDARSKVSLAVWYLVAYLIAFFGGLLVRTLPYRSVRHSLFAYSIPVLLGGSLIQAPALMELLKSGWPLDLKEFREWTTWQCAALLVTGMVTGIGWFCTYCIQAIFED